MKKSLFHLLYGVLLFLLSCSDHTTTEEPAVKGTPATSTEEGVPAEVVLPPQFSRAEREAVENIAGFDTKFFSAANAVAGEGNFVCSPFSAAMLLSMLSNVTEPATSAEIAAALGTSDTDALNSFSSKYLEWLPVADPAVKIGLANSVWYDNGKTLNTSFADIASKCYAAEMCQRDFSDNAKLLSDVNSWIDDKTSGLIPEMLKSIDPAVIAMQINALYFNGRWSNIFDKGNTVKGDFHTPGATIKVDMMNQRELHSYCETSDYKAIKLDFGGSLFNAEIIMPSAGQNIDDFISSGIVSKQRAYTPCDVKLALPRFRIAPCDKNLDVLKVLKQLGVKGFDKAQNVSIFTKPTQGHFTIEQNAAIEFSEKGAEGAAATVSIMCNAGEPFVPEFKEVTFDRPFLFIISDYGSHRCLFAGKVINPAI